MCVRCADAEPLALSLSLSLPSHQPSHECEPWWAVIEGVLAVAEDIRAFLGARVRAGVVHEGFVIHEIIHLALPLISQLGDVRVGRGEGGRGRAVSQVLVHAAVEDRWTKYSASCFFCFVFFAFFSIAECIFYSYTT